MHFLQPRLALGILFQNVFSIFDARVYAMHLWEIYMYGVTYLWEICMYRCLRIAQKYRKYFE